MGVARAARKRHSIAAHHSHPHITLPFARSLCAGSSVPRSQPQRSFSREAELWPVPPAEPHREHRRAGYVSPGRRPGRPARWPVPCRCPHRDTLRLMPTCRQGRDLGSCQTGRIVTGVRSARRRALNGDRWSPRPPPLVRARVANSAAAWCTSAGDDARDDVGVEGVHQSRSTPGSPSISWQRCVWARAAAMRSAAVGLLGGVAAAFWAGVGRLAGARLPASR